MSLDSIVKITISTQNLQMAQAGFGIPLILGKEHDGWPDRVKTFSDPSALGKITISSPLYRMAQVLISQNPKLPKAKIGSRKSGESVEEALNAIINEDNDFYGVLLVNEHGDDDAKYMDDVESLSRAVMGKRLLAGVDIGEKHLPVATTLKDKNIRNLFTMYKADKDDYPSAAWMGKMLPQPPGSASWAFKELDGIKKSKLPTDLIENLKSLNVNHYITINNIGITLDGCVAKGEYIDIIHGIDWLHVRIQERLFRLLMINEKIPYTKKGVDLVRSEIMAQLKDAVYRGLLAADPEPQVSIPDIEDIDPVIRGKRQLPDVKFGGRLTGAIHEIVIQGTVSV